MPERMGLPSFLKVVPEILEDHILPFNWDVRKVWELEAKVTQIPYTEFAYLLELPLWSSVAKHGLLFDICPMDVYVIPICLSIRLSDCSRSICNIQSTF